MDRIAQQEVPRLLGMHLGLPVPTGWKIGRHEQGFEMVLVGPHGRFPVAVKSAGSCSHLRSVIARLKEQHRRHSPGDIPLLVVPYMGEQGGAMCREAGVSWMDLSGNADIRAEGIVVNVRGHPNAFPSRGRPSSVFAPKSARVTRYLLEDPKTPHTQREIARAVGLGEGYVSRIIRRLVQDLLLSRDTAGRIVVPDPDRLLDAWSDEEDFQRHRIQPGFIAAKTGQELIDRLHHALAPSENPYAFSGLAGAWLLTRFATFRLATVFVLSPPSPSVLASAGFLDEPKGANCWLVVPRDEGVLHGAKPVRGVPCASPVQVYVDLKGHPERAKEAAEELRRTSLPWRARASGT